MPTETVLEVARAVLTHNRASGNVPTQGEPLWWWTRLENAVEDESEQECFAVLSHVRTKTLAHMTMATVAYSPETLSILERIGAVLGEFTGLGAAARTPAEALAVTGSQFNNLVNNLDNKAGAAHE